MKNEEVLKHAQNPKAHPVILRKLIDSNPSLAVRMAVYKNPNCPSSLFQQLGIQLEKVLPYEAMTVNK
ncbi:hypothetical protein KKA08_02180 [bacterium]|nr:hypothetical protein [bacterium]